MESLTPIQSQGRPTPVDGFGYASNKHLFDWIAEHRSSQEARQTFLEDMDRKVRDTKPYSDERIRRDLEIYDEIERSLVQRSEELVGRDNFKRDVYREEFAHTDIYYS